MRREVNVYDWTCDRCGAVTRHEGEDAPVGWERSDWYCDSPACDGHEHWLCGACVEQGTVARMQHGGER